MMTVVACGLITASCMLVSVGDRHPVMGEGYTVEAVASEAGLWYLHVHDKNAGRGRRIDVSPLVEKITGIHTHADRIIVEAKLEANLECITGYNANDQKEVFSMMGRYITFSPDMRWAVFESFYPTHFDLSQVWPTVNVVDTYSAEPTERVVFPEGGNLASKPEGSRSKWFIVSPILWDVDSSGFIVLLDAMDVGAGDTLHLLVVRDIDGARSVEVVVIAPDLVREAAKSTRGFWSFLSLKIEADELTIYYRESDKYEKPLASMPFSWHENSAEP